MCVRMGTVKAVYEINTVHIQQWKYSALTEHYLPD